MNGVAPDSHEAWSKARKRMLHLESSTEHMSSRWFFGNAGVIAAAILFLLTAIVLALSVAHMLDNAAKAEQSQTIQLRAGNLQDALAESSAAARAYSLARDDSSLRARALANKAALANLAALRTTMADDADGLALLAEIRFQVARRITLYNALMTSGAPALLPSAETERMKIIRLNNIEISRLRQRAAEDFRRYQTRVIDDMNLAMVLVLISGITAPLFGLIGIRLLRRERESQQTRELQLELIHVQRLAIMGETSAMLAHEINQPLSAASNYITVVRRHLERGSADKAQEVLERVEQQVQRAAAIVRKLRRFIEKREAERSAESPDTLAEDAITLLGTIDGSVELTTQVAPDLPCVLVDRVQVQQVLVNLMRNAIEAMQTDQPHNLVLAMTYAGGRTIEVSLADTGPGLSPDVAERLFQPFVSTKSGGMGVGLSICQSIVSQHGGRIWAEANPGGGTVFRFTLPIAVLRAAA